MSFINIFLDLRKWPYFDTFFTYPLDIRKVISTNTIGSLNGVIRHTIRKRNVLFRKARQNRINIY